jgi:hypothetical protein
LVIYAVLSSSVTLGAVLLTGGQGLLVIALAWLLHHFVGLPWSLYALNRYVGISPRRQIGASIRPLVATALMACAVLAVAALTKDFAQTARLIATVATGAASYFIAIAMIDRTTVQIGRSLFSDMVQLRRSARTSA